MSCDSEEKQPQVISSRANGHLGRLTKTSNISTEHGATDKLFSRKGSEQEIINKRLCQRERGSDNAAFIGRNESREIEIRDHVLAIGLSQPGVKITHCNFGKKQVEVWYVTEKTNSDTVVEELQEKIGSNVEPYKLKLVKKSGFPIFKYTSPGQSTSLRRAAAGSIGAYVTLTENDESKLHALVSGHGKAKGDMLYFNSDTNQTVGEVKVAKDGTRRRLEVGAEYEHQYTNSFDVGLVLVGDQQVARHETSVTTNEYGRIQLAEIDQPRRRPTDDDDEEDKVMLFNNDNRQGTICYQNYNRVNPEKFGMIGIAQGPDGERQAVHAMNESGTLVAALPPYTENGVQRVEAVGMLIGIEEITESAESISLAVPIVTNLQELVEDDYCANKEIKFA